MAAISSRYARALADVIFAAKLDPAKSVQDLQDIANLLQSSPDLRSVWEIPAIPAEEKLKLLDAVAASSSMSKPVRNFIGILIEKRRLNMLQDMIVQLKAELNDRLGFADAEVTSARTLSDDERRLLEAQISKVTGKNVRAQFA